ncbi:MAG TPA: lysophospholipid acyltransferase family protein [Chthoniobacteraceae bacterium]|nr:lysophospholipid acyltransferase family protein [Chthoniobacteraceae bacterium]
MISRLIASGIYSTLGNVRVLHGERSAMPGPYVLASNHISHFDPPLLSVATRRKIDWMAMKDLFKHPLASLYLNTIETFPVDRDNLDRASVRTALQRLKKGHIVGMFPEGGIRAGSTSVLEGAPMRPGAGALAHMADVPLLPCVILGTDRLYKRANWRIFGSVPFWVGFGEPIRPASGMDKAEARAYLERELATAFKNLLAELRAHFQLSDADIPKTPGERRVEA